MTLGLQVPKEKAQAVKTSLLAMQMLDTSSDLLKDEKTITFPVLHADAARSFPFAKLVTASFPKLPKKESFRESLVALLGPHQHLLSGFDVVGDIALLDIPPVLRKKGKKVAQLILSTHPHIKTVVRKGGIHHGRYRVQQMVHLAGEKKMETVSKENGILAKVHVGKVYFSPRLAEERKRIASLVHPGERIVVFFSGVGIYPLVLARNTKAAWVYGIELNPLAHRYAMENKQLNHLRNVTFIRGDANKAQLLPSIIGLSSHRPSVSTVQELTLAVGDLEKKLPLLEKKLARLRKAGRTVMLAAPPVYHHESVALDNPAAGPCFAVLRSLCKNYGLLGFVVSSAGPQEKLLAVLPQHRPYLDYLYLENNGYPSRFEHVHELHNAGLKHTIVNISKYLQEYRSMQTVIGGIKQLPTTLFFRLDHMPITQGLLDVVDVGVASKETFDSLRKHKKRVDRIIMPLPKDAADFLGSALAVAKKGTIIHFYDFFAEEDIPAKPEQKIKALCKKHGVQCTLLNVVKCGHYAPYVFRICVDFRIE
ncbi:hypothetical protein HY639_05560 [Candidatus Woesearchaeota archaeon]|nr:hypothetical protein [Candidatus Woesearchaeota archaeon]